MKNLFLIFLLLQCILGFSQKKTLQTKFTTEKIILDGKQDEAIWQSVPIATDFVMFQPDNGKPVPENKRTEVRVLYDNEALYISALLYDNEPDKILREINKRDEFGTADFFGVFVNGYNDGQQNFQFFVNAADGQADCLATDSNGEDYSWDAVWESKAIITSFGWAVEMRIPYAALRFPSEKKQTWGGQLFQGNKKRSSKIFMEFY
ncbi:carbohydrate binding family 9 domain-containing protein [Flavobacterium laiguense]|uniref:carbohydrate binding family 9 domain-containing protein n=1 Tax=Flavobacterium laiguense TaxID=2169409 RepID=UPI00293714BE|nr:carbohydrate binding family 9 domain-containing protein [Flavobacterium laiguense]